MGILGEGRGGDMHMYVLGMFDYILLLGIELVKMNMNLCTWFNQQKRSSNAGLRLG